MASMNKSLVLTLLALAVAWYVWNPALDAPLADELAAVINAPDGFSSKVSIRRPPLQTMLEPPSIVQVDEYDLSLIADFQLEALVLGRRDYLWGDEARLSPIDLALGWGPMADREVVDQINIRQSSRFYFWQVEHYPIERSAIISNSANMHLIPASPEVFAQLQRTEAGKNVRLRGFLVNVERANGWYWRSSTSRTDSGSGACELILVTRAEVF
jgi:hypothetical protein